MIQPFMVDHGVFILGIQQMLSLSLSGKFIKFLAAKNGIYNFKKKVQVDEILVDFSLG